MRDRNLSPATIRRRILTLSRLQRDVGPLPALTPEQVLAWLRHFPAPATRRAYLGDIRAWCAWSGADLCDAIPSPRIPSSLPHPLTEAELARVLGCADRITRQATMVAAYAGLRTAEISALRHSEIVDGVLWVRHGKGGRDRQVPLHPLLEAEGLGCGHGWVLGVHLEPGSLGSRVGGTYRALGIPGRLHRARARFATQLYRATPDLLLVASLLGHSSTQTTQRYVALDGDRARDAVRRVA